VVNSSAPCLHLLSKEFQNTISPPGLIATVPAPQ
jgi:hypothetical protein